MFGRLKGQWTCPIGGAAPVSPSAGGSFCVGRWLCRKTVFDVRGIVSTGPVRDCRAGSSPSGPFSRPAGSPSAPDPAPSRPPGTCPGDRFAARHVDLAGRLEGCPLVRGVAMATVMAGYILPRRMPHGSPTEEVVMQFLKISQKVDELDDDE